jgi:hypothetical protein
MTFREYAAHGWALCALERGKKGPTYPQWQKAGIPLDAADGLEGAGLIHELAGTCALDVDDMDAAAPWLLERGVDIQALLNADNAVQIVSGRPNRAKLLYRMKRPLRTMKPKGAGLELRCRGAQDVLPPSVHPNTGKPYQWATGLMGDWRTLPPIPAGLLAIWRGLDDGDAAPTDVPAEPAPRVDVPRLRKAAFRHSPDCDYDEWIRVGMALHDGTQGDQAGFDVWREWSKGIKRAPYPGDVVLKSHWLSFESGPGKHVATGKALEAELPAEADDFPVVEDAGEPPAADVSKAAQRKAALEALINRFVFVIHEQEYFDTARNALIGDKAIRHLMTPLMPRKSGREVDPIDRLMRAKDKTAVEAMAFHPGEASIFTHRGKRYANTFFAESVPKPVEPMKDELDKINWLFDRIDDPAFRKWLKQFYAHVVQQPGIKIRSAPLIWSKTQGNGKSTIVGTIPKLLVGAEYYAEVTQDELNSPHNDYLIGKWHVTLAEFRAGSRGERETISKKVERWIADDILSIHPKGTKGYSIPNHLVVTASTNKDDAAMIDANDRKWAVHMLDAPAMTQSEKASLFQGFLMTPRAPGVLRHYFLNVDLEGFDANADAPKTAARNAMIDASIPLDYEMLLTAFEERAEPLARDIVITREVGEYVRRHCVVKPSNDRIGRLLCSAPFDGLATQWRAGEARYRGVIIRNRARWNGATSADIMAHIAGDDADIAVDSLLL